MIAIADSSGKLLRAFPEVAQGVIGFDRRYGFITEAAARARALIRKRHGLKAEKNLDWRCQFEIQSQNGSPVIRPLFGCEAAPREAGGWSLNTDFGSFVLTNAPLPPEVASPVDQEQKRGRVLVATSAVLMSVLLNTLGRQMPSEPVVEREEPVAVQVIELKEAVRVPPPKILSGVEKLADSPSQEKKVRQAVNQELGFLGLLGRKDLKKAVGGVPTQIRDASPGAGPGGKEGSGGELLVGLGKGLKKTTVGNTGVAGLGGIGTKGAGGGAGGYGDAMIASGAAKRVSSLALSDELVLEGGLDRSVVQATIAKYLSQVRACYEAGLRRNAGLTGVVNAHFEIGGSGEVLSSRIGRSTLGDASVEGCIASKMKTWQFPKPLGGTKVKVEYPFLLRPVRST